jgi:hypothetical protein
MAVASSPVAGALGLPSAGPTKLVGTFALQGGKCTSTGATGSFVAVSLAGVSPGSNCPSGVTTVQPGSDGGIVTGQYQLDPNPTFASGGSSLAGSIITPVAFLGKNFGMATTCTNQELQYTPTGACPTGSTGFPVPTIYAEPVGTGGCNSQAISAAGKAAPSGLLGTLLSVLGSLLAPVQSATGTASVSSGFSECLYGNMLGFGVTYGGTTNCQVSHGQGCYAQGAESNANLQPVACTGGSNCGLTGAYDPSSGQFVLILKATVKSDDEFNGAVGTYTFAGTFTSKVNITSTTAASTTGGSTGGSPTSTTVAPGGFTGRPMNGTFSIANSGCNGSPPKGAWVQLSKGGSVISNSAPGAPSCDSGNYTLLTQGTQGLKTGQFQPDPSPTFDSSQNSLANSIITPVDFLGGKFGMATDPQDEQHNPNGPAVFPVPEVYLLPNGSLRGQLEAINVTFKGQANSTCGNESIPGTGCFAVGTSDATGSYNPSTKAYNLTWSAPVVGGLFNGSTATFNLAGTFSGTIASPVSVGPVTTTTTGASTTQTTSTPVVTQTTVASQPTTTGAVANSMIGTFSIVPGTCDGNPPTGSWVSLSLNGDISNKANPSSCDGGDYTLMTSGTQGGLKTGVFQPNPTPTFDANGNSLANAIVQPVSFLGSAFGIATMAQNEQDNPNGPAVFPVPTVILNSNDTLSANVSSVVVTYNGNPNSTCASGDGDGCFAVGSTDATGTYNPTTHAYTLAWQSTIHGNTPFTGAVASFHLAGTFSGTIVKSTAPTGITPSTSTTVSPTTTTTAAPPGPSTPSGSKIASSKGASTKPASSNQLADYLPPAAGILIVLAAILGATELRRRRASKAAG